jgi:hypothetical protein
MLVCWFAISTAAAEELRMQVNLPKGFTCEAEIALETRCLTCVHPDIQWNYRRQRTTTFLCRVVERPANGDMHIEFQYQRVRDIQYSSEGRAYPCDTNDPNLPNARERLPFRRVALNALCGKTFVAVVAATGAVRRIEGASRLYDDLHYDLVSCDQLPGEPQSHEDLRRWLRVQGERCFKEFFGVYWPLSEDSLKEVVQPLFVIWPEAGLDKGTSWHVRNVQPALALRRVDFWTLRHEHDGAVLVELVSDVRTDLGLCDPNAPEPPSMHDYDTDYLRTACYWRRKGEVAPVYCGERRGTFNVDARSGVVRDATWSEELTGIASWRRDRDTMKTEPIACPSTRTESVSIRVIPR